MFSHCNSVKKRKNVSFLTFLRFRSNLYILFFKIKDYLHRAILSALATIGKLSCLIWTNVIEYKRNYFYENGAQRS